MQSPYITDSQEEEEINGMKSNSPLILIVVGMIAISGYFYMKIQALERKTSQILGVTTAVAKVNTTVAQLQIPDISPTGSSPAQLLTSTPPSPSQQPFGLIPAVTAQDHIRGNINAKVVLIEYSDLECPFCKRFDPTMKQIIKEYGDKIAWVYRHYPLPFHQNAQKEAEASECAAELGGNDTFWEYIDAILERTTSNGTGFELAKLVPLAEELGIDKTKFKTCLDSGTYAQKIKGGIDSAAKGGVNGTPATIIIPATGKRDIISGALPFEQIKQQLDQILK